MSAFLELKEQLNKLRQRKLELTLSADASIKAAKDILATSGMGIVPISEIDLQSARLHLDHAIKDQIELAEVLGSMRRLERELGQ